jgi:hypothetical protein
MEVFMKESVEFSSLLSSILLLRESRDPFA